jgi:3-phenylpropionate/trans-cinnamate dioxygenase ferredoxin subunit
VKRTPLGKADLAVGAMRGVELPDGRLVLVTRLDDGFHALDDVCNHAGCLLSDGRLESTRVVCPCHEMAFDVRTGKATVQPAWCDDQPVLRVAVDAGELFLEE